MGITESSTRFEGPSDEYLGRLAPMERVVASVCTARGPVSSITQNMSVAVEGAEGAEGVVCNVIGGMQSDEPIPRMTTCGERDCGQSRVGSLSRCAECACRIGLSPLVKRVVTKDEERWMLKIDTFRRGKRELEAFWRKREYYFLQHMGGDVLWEALIVIFYEKKGMHNVRVRTSY